MFCGEGSVRATRIARLAIGSMAVLLSACDRDEPMTPTVPKTTAAQVEIDPAASGRVIAATLPATRPAGSVIFLDASAAEFPSCKLVLPDKAGSPVLLMSDDPPEAINENYAGNSFYFELPLDVKSMDELAGMAYPYRAASAERMETLNGIFLNGNRKQLQPYDYSLTFSKEDDVDVVLLRGTFLQFDSPDDQAPKQVTVAARFRPRAVGSK